MDIIITNEDNDLQLQPIMIEELKRAIFELGGLRDLGPNGFSSLFFQQSWGVLKDDVLKMVRGFFEEGCSIDKLNDKHSHDCQN